MRVRVSLSRITAFDGAASAAFFSAVFVGREILSREPTFCFTGLAHKASQLFEPGYVSTATINAIVDFNNSTDPPSSPGGFRSPPKRPSYRPEDGEHFRRRYQRLSNSSIPRFASCTKYIATVACEKFGYDSADLKELVGWGRTSSTARACIKTLREAVDLGNARHAALR